MSYIVSDGSSSAVSAGSSGMGMATLLPLLLPLFDVDLTGVPSLDLTGVISLDVDGSKIECSCCTRCDGSLLKFDFFVLVWAGGENINDWTSEDSFTFVKSERIKTTVKSSSLVLFPVQTFSALDSLPA